MRRNFKRGMAVACATTMALGLTACASKTQAPETTTAAPTQAQQTEATTEAPTEAKVDLGGMEIIIADWWSSGEPAEILTDYDEARAAYLEQIQEEYNFTIKELSFSSWADMPADFVKYVTTGEGGNSVDYPNAKYIFTMRQGSELCQAIANGNMYDLTKLDCLDFSDSKWCHSIDAVTDIGGAKYGMRGQDHEVTFGMFFNKRLLELAKVDPEEIYQLQRDNKWTWEEFERILDQCTYDSDGDGITDMWGMTNFTSDLYPAMVFSNDGAFISFDENGKFVNTLESEKTLKALNYTFDLLKKYEMPAPEGANWDYMFGAFNDGMAAFEVGGAYRAGNTWNDMQDDFGFVCMPMGPDAKGYSNLATDNVYVIPASYDDDTAWKLAFAYNLYTDPVPGFEDYEGWKAGYKNFRDDESLEETCRTLVATGVTALRGAVPGIELGPQLFWQIRDEEGHTPAEMAESLRTSWQGYIDVANGDAAAAQ